MSEIVKRDYQMGLVHKLSNELEALTSEKIYNLPPLEVDKVLMTAVHKAYKDKGQEATQDQIDHVVDNLLESVLKSCPFIRIAEIPIAIEKGILGEYGEYFGLNVVTFTKFIKSHYESAERARNAKKKPIQEEEKKEPTAEDVLNADKDLLIRAFETYKKVGYYEDHGNYIYRVAAKKLNLFNLSEERQKEYLSKGKERAIEYFKNELISKPMERRRLNQCINEANELIKGSDGLKRVYKESLQLALMDWFKDLVEMETNIEDLLNN